MMFYLLSLLTGILECGWIAYGAVHTFPLWQILCYPLAYHIGNLFPKPFSLNRRSLSVMATLSVLTGSLTRIPQLSEKVAFVLTCVTLFLLSAVIQSVRSGLKSDGNRLCKRVFRVAGFALAPLAAVIPTAVLLAASVTALIALRRHQGRTGFTSLTSQGGYSAVMIFHQLHYFFYAHITLAAVSLLFAHDSGILGAWFCALLFCGTWITYMSVEPIISKCTDRIVPVFFAGHLGIGLLLFGMHFVTDLRVFILLWIVTGCGGGVVYTIAAKAKASGQYDKDAMTVSENLGHTFGLMTAVGIAALMGERSHDIMLLFGSVSALLAAVSMAIILGSGTIRKELHHENR